MKSVQLSIDSPSSSKLSRAGREIAIIGMSGRFPGGANSPSGLWDLLISGRDGVTEAKGDRWDLGWHHPDAGRDERVYTRAGGFLDRIDSFDAEFFGISPKEARQVDPQHRLLLELAWEAMEDANLAPRKQAGADIGVFIGISGNDYANLVGPQGPDAYSNTGSSLSIAANRISYIFDLHGPSVALDTACSSSLVCVHQACMSLLAGECSSALAGGVNLLVHVRPWIGFSKASMLSPTGRCKSFDASGDGYVRSEGGGLVLLKPLADAERDGDNILGVILASGVNSDGRTLGLSMPNGDAQERLLRKVYAQCGLRADDVFYVEAHGTGTSVGDPIECGALGRVLGTPREDGSSCLIGSVKSNIGHLEAASGIAGLAKVLLSLKHRTIPGNLHFANPNPKIDFKEWKLDVVTEAISIPSSERPIIVGVNSFGFGGTNAHLIIQEYHPTKVIDASHDPVPTDAQRVLVLSGHSQGALAAVAASYIELLRKPLQASWEDICAGAATTRSMQRYRLAVAATAAEEAVTQLEQYLAAKPTRRFATGSASSVTPRLAFVYSGNGPQWWGMGRELLAASEVFREEIEAIDKTFAALARWSLLDEMQRPESESRVALTEVAQPLLFALQLGLTKLLRDAGAEPAGVVGHSVGEVAAAYVSGALSLEDATRIIYYRSHAQAKTAGTGRMAALGVGVNDAMNAMRDIDGWLEIAAENSPESVTVAGDPVALERLIYLLTEKGKFARLLPLNYPFHTKAMEPIRNELIIGLQGLKPARSRIPFISTVEAAEIDGRQLDAEYWFRNVREKVEFSKAISALIQDQEIGVFLEIGPHPVLKEYVQQIAKSSGATIASLQSLRRPGPKGAEPEVDALWTAICACHANGAIDLDTVFHRPVPAPALPLYPWQRTPHWRGGVILPDVFHPTHRDHPLLGYPMTTGEGIWENTLDTNLIAYLRDHVVQRSVVFPAAGYFEMALSAGQRTLGEGEIVVEDLEILRPLAIPEHGDPLIQFSFDAGTSMFEIRSRPTSHSSDWLLHVRGRISRNDLSVNERTDIGKLSSTLPHEISFEEHYSGTAVRGLEYGPRFQGVVKIAMTPAGAEQQEALGVIHLPELDADALTGYRAHPSLLDSCLQVMVTLVVQNERRNCAIIPVRFERLRSYDALPASIVCHIILRHESDRSATADFKVFDTQGNLLLQIEEARCQKIDFGQAGTAPFISEWWRIDPSFTGPETLPTLPTSSHILKQMKPGLDRDIRANLRAEFYRDLRPRLNELALAYIAHAIYSITDGEKIFDPAVLERRGVVGGGELGVFRRIIELGNDQGLFIAENGLVRQNKEPLPDPNLLWRQLFLKFPQYQAELLLMAQAGEELPDVLRGKAGSEISAASLDRLFESAPFQLVYNHIARTALETLVDHWPKDRPLRILELGGGGGALTSWLLPVLPALRTDYLFSDPTESAIGRAEHRFAAYRFVRFMTLDDASDLIAQGLPTGYFDLVVAGNFLHTSNNLESLLAQLRNVMAPDGRLLILEAHRSIATELIFLRDASWSDDTGAELSSRLKDAGSWLKTLELSGFENTNLLSDSEAAGGDETQQSIILAQRSKQALIEFPPVPIAVEKKAARRWLLVIEYDVAGAAFKDALTEALGFGDSEVTCHVVKPEVSSSFNKLWAECDADSVVYISAASTLGLSPGDLLRAENARCLTVLDLVRTLEATRLQHPAQLTLVTRGAFATALGQGPLDPAQSPLWGLGRVVANEHPGLACQLVDFHVGNSPEAAMQLAKELLNRDSETEVQLSAGFRFVNRERLTTLADETRTSVSVSNVKSESYMLDFAAQGGLDSLYLRSKERVTPGDGKVEIAVRAAGLNFRDVLWTMGVLPEEAVEEGFSGPTIGMECAGEVVRVGTGVDAFKPGDRVVAFASSCFASHVTTDAGSISLMPEGLEFSAAATIPTAFLTAYYALDRLANLQAGESILIHGAAGGVGLAAIQIAKMKGARVFGTAGSDRKRRMLQRLGVEHVLNSRSLDFADEVMTLTDGVGVDVVLNSLAGEAITRSLKCLRSFGRFLEIGKRDLYANTHLGLRPFRRNLSYFAIDADTLLMERRDLARSIFKQVMDLFADGKLTPLPFEVVPISRATEAFRTMQQSRHVGKLVISTELDVPNTLPIVETQHAVKTDATYLVTGGLGGFGLATAKWLVEQGATSLALISRRGAVTEEAQEGIAQLEAAGAVVEAFAADIADPGSLEEALRAIRSSMPPIKGVIHSAAVIEDAPISQIGPEQLNRVLAPKIAGAWNLHQKTLSDPIDMFILYSSSSTVVGNPGQGAYVAGNLYLDSLAQYRRSLGLAGLAVGWGAIKDVGFLTRHENVAEMLRTRTGMDATPSEEALRDLGRLWSAGATRMCVARFDLQRLGRILPGTLVPRFLPIVTPAAASALSAEETLASRLLQIPASERRSAILNSVKEHAAKVLGAGSAQIDVDQPLADLGLDSLMAVELAVALERDLERPVSVMQLLSAGNINAIAELALKMVNADKGEAATVEVEKGQVMVAQ